MEANADTNEDILLALKAAALVDKMCHKLQVAEAKRLKRTLVDAERQSRNGDADLDSNRGGDQHTLPPILRYKDQSDM